MQLRDYQQRAVNFLQNKQRGFIVSPAGSGKTIMAAAAAANVPARNERRSGEVFSFMWRSFAVKIVIGVGVELQTIRSVRSATFRALPGKPAVAHG